MNNGTNLHLQEVLDTRRRALLPFLASFTSQGYILGGGTALALMFGHRESIDFDFFIDQELNIPDLFQYCLDLFDQHKVVKVFDAKNTLTLSVDTVKISFFSYHHKRIAPLVTTPHLTLYSIQDIAAMKLRALQNRATMKDYVDLYYLIHKLSLEKVLNTFTQKFGPVVTQSHLLKSLMFFDDVQKEPLILHDPQLNWNTIQENLTQEVLSFIAQHK